ncbi:hypothetical protein [Gracilimonas tropica]|uniref:hypothetical protein n=1 Tax=Gracilimonas tropica TaxID=454600 RepID=UPI00037CFAE5|nr:hypothetical protein [Gracilimonas tropica]
MRSFLIWLLSVLLGGLAGYGTSYLVNFNLYLLIAFGVIIGSSIGITLNIHREREEEIELLDLEAEKENDNTRPSGDPISQKEL